MADVKTEPADIEEIATIIEEHDVKKGSYAIHIGHKSPSADRVCPRLTPYFQNMLKKQKHPELLKPRLRIDSIQDRYLTHTIHHLLNYSIYLVGICLAFCQNLLRIHSRKRLKKDFMGEHIFVHCALLKILSEKVIFDNFFYKNLKKNSRLWTDKSSETVPQG